MKEDEDPESQHYQERPDFRVFISLHISSRHRLFLVLSLILPRVMSQVPQGAQVARGHQD